MKDAKREAESILNGVWRSIVGSRLIPVDPIKIATELGIDVFFTELELNVAGAIVQRPYQDPTIMLNRSDHPNRQRFTCAHELGHFVLRSDDDSPAFEYVDRRDVLASQGTSPVEMFANAFAANLLMPEGELRRWKRDGLSNAELTARFKVSREAMANRLVNLGLVGSGNDA